MKVLYFIVLKNDRIRNRVMKALDGIKVNGVVLASTSVRHALLESNIEPLPDFGALRHVVENVHYNKSTILTVVDEEQIELVKKTVKEASKGCGENAGRMYTVPVSNYEEIEG